VPRCCEALAFVGLKALREGKELSLKMIDSKVSIVEYAVLSVWIIWIIERTAHASRHIKTTRDANEADGVKAICVLEDLCF